MIPPGDSEMECLSFKKGLANSSDQLMPALLFDKLVRMGIEFLSAKSQFIAKILKHYVMSTRTDRMVLPYDLEIIKYITIECMPIRLPYFLLTCFAHYYEQNCMGLGLVLIFVFKFLR